MQGPEGRRSKREQAKDGRQALGGGPLMHSITVTVTECSDQLRVFQPCDPHTPVCLAPGERVSGLQPNVPNNTSPAQEIAPAFSFLSSHLIFTQLWLIKLSRHIGFIANANLSKVNKSTVGVSVSS